MKDEHNIWSQVFMFFLAMTLFVFYYFSIFRPKGYNNLALAFSIVTFVLFVSIVCRYSSSKLSDVKENALIEIPYCIKCFPKTDHCESGDINQWSLMHFVVYMLIGLYIPNLYIEILYISIFCELIETGMGYTSKYIMDPLTNLFGYFIGTILHKQRYIHFIKPQVEFKF